MPTRRLLLTALPPALLAACGGEPEPPPPLPDLVIGYRHLTPLRINVLDIEVPEPQPGTVQVTEPVTMRPDQEMRRMAQDRLVPTGTTGLGRFLVTTARFVREPGDRLVCHLVCRLEIMSGENRRVAFVEAQVQRTQTLGSSSPTARSRAAEAMIRGAMEELNVEFEFQIRRTLRAWLVEGPPGAAPAPVEVERETLSGAQPPASAQPAPAQPALAPVPDPVPAAVPDPAMAPAVPPEPIMPPGAQPGVLRLPVPVL